MKLNHKTTRFIHLALTSSLVFAGEIFIANQTPATIETLTTVEIYNNEKSLESSIPDYSLIVQNNYSTKNNTFLSESNGNPEMITMSRDGETIYQFTNCGQTGRTGPSQSQIDNAYAETTLDGAVTVSGGLQSWVVPATGIYTIETYGAQGAGPSDNPSYQRGAKMAGDFELNAGDILKILVGQEGLWGPYNGNNSCGGVNSAGGGGGGTFLVKSDNTPLIIAGGGGAYNQANNSYTNATTASSGITPTSVSGDGGTNGGGGGAGTDGNAGNGYQAGGNGSSCAYGPGGGGFYSNGGSNCGGGNTSNGISFLNGGLGGESVNGCMSNSGGAGAAGGFGGGASGGHRSGGGGGYSGGGGGAYTGGGGGGGSYNAGINQDNQGGIRSGHGLVVITSLAPPNAPPTATAQSVTGNEDSPQTITLAGNDPEGEVLTFALATNSSNGASTLSGNVVTYTPNTNYNGSDSFTFTVSDGESTSSPATVNISVTAVNDAPTAATQSVSGNEDAAQTITLTGSDIDGDGLTYALATNSSNGASTLSGNVVTYTPNTNYNGSDSFTFTASDGELTSSAATVNITVASVNDLPVISSTPALDALDGSLYEYSLSVSDVDEDVVAITATGPNWLTVGNSTLSGTPGPSDGGLHEIILSANDGNGGVVTQTYTLAVSLHSLVITGGSGHRIFSSPVSGTIYGDLLDELWTQGAQGSDSPNSNPNIWTYGNGWNSVTDFSSDALTAGKGFLMYVFADTDFDGDDDLNDPENPVIISIDGAQQESGVSVVSEPSGWNLIGNPYGLSVDISQMLSDNNTKFNSTVYSLDRTSPGYRTHNGVVGNIENDEIKPFDGFWIKADTDGDVFEFTEQSIRKGSINAGRTTTDDSNGSAVFTFTNGDYSSSTYLSFTEEGQINLDPADADRLVPMSPAEHLTSMIYESNKSLAINNLPFDLSTDISFPMDVMMLSPTDDGYATQAEQVDLTWDITDLPEGITLELTNNITGQNINLTGDLSATISLPNKGSFLTSGDFMGTYPAVGQAQFTLSVYGTLAAVEDDVLPERLTLHSAYPNPFNPSTLIRFDLSNADMVSLDIFDIAGKQVASLINEYMIPGNHQISWNPGNLSSGIYLVNLVVGTETFNEKITFIK